ncbi:MAG: GDSL-type esterase/lipase family protein [Hyphomicrobiaceae bacterium]
MVVRQHLDRSCRKRAWPLLGLLLCLAGMTGPAMAAPFPEPVITWKVENPFRLFRSPADTEMHRATFEALPQAERRTPILNAERQLSARHRDGWAITVFGRTCWNPKRNRYQCSDPADYINPKSHVVIARIEGLQIQGKQCVWLLTPRHSRKVKPAAVPADCREPVKLVVPYPLGATVSVLVDGSQAAETVMTVEDLLVVGLGDSFGSGEGNPDQPIRFSRDRAIDYARGNKRGDLLGYPTRIGTWSKIGDKGFLAQGALWHDQACHRSLYSHQLRVALQLAVENPHRAVTFLGFACSGAEITNGLFLRYKGNEWVPTPPDKSQISSVATAQCGGTAPLVEVPEAYHLSGKVPELQNLSLHKCDRKKARRIDLVLVSIGGNDVGFSRLVANAILSDASTLRRIGGWFGQVHGRKQARPQIVALADRYKALMRAVHNILHVPWDESDRVILTAYPRLALLGDGKSVCPDGQAGMTVLPDFSLSEAKAREGEQVADMLHAAMKETAKLHGWTFIDAHRQAFAGHSICAGFVDNAFSLADDLRFPRRIADAWVPYNPADFRPYASRERWYRTPNDAYLTGHFHVSGSLIRRILKQDTLSWFQLVLASTYSGAFHPTAEGQAAIGDAVLIRARKVLAKYKSKGD